ncbi:MAG: endospore germination permease [Peptococcaceae bacterium]|nr:spore germination protein [Peptococcaceae bacterium]MDH7525897.1 endospore germination permease [Peptococcaceae bacterium]
MWEQAKIDGKQAVMLMLSMVLPTAILTVPSLTVRLAKQDAWLSIAVAVLAGLLIARLAVSLSLLFPGKTLLEYSEEILGKAAGKVVGLLYIWWFLHMGAVVIREFGVFLVTAIMPETPIIVFHIVVAAVAAYAVRSGLEVLSRFNQLFIPLTGFLAVAFVLSVKDMQMVRLLPVFDTGLLPVLKGAAVPASWMGEIVVFTMFIPSLKNPGEAHRLAALSVLLIGFFLTLSILEALLIFGPEITAAWLFPTFNAVRVVSIAGFLERLESVITVVWVAGGFIKVGVFYYAAVLGSAQWAGLKDYRPLVIPVGVVLVSLSILLHENVADMFAFLALTWPPYALLVFEGGIPLLLLAAALAGGKGRKGGR